MYKKQMTVQKILCLLAVVVAVILFLYALGFMTDLYDTLYTTLRIRVEEGAEGGYSLNVTERDVPGAKVYTNIQSFNQWLVIASIVYILLAVLLFVTNTNIRRRYYIGNYVSICLFAAASLYIPIASHGTIEAYKAQWLKVDFAALKEYSETFSSAYTESTLWFDLHYAAYALMIVAAILLVANALWKIVLMKDEAKLVVEGGAVASASNEDNLIQRDRMRFVKNSMCANLCYLAILLDIFYFVLLYRSDVGTYFYTIQIGASIVYNLLFLLIVFLSSEEVKNYNKKFSNVLFAIGALQIIRIFVMPLAARSATISVDGVDVAVMGNSQFIRSAIYLAVSAACLFVSAGVNSVRCNDLEAHKKSLESEG